MNTSSVQTSRVGKLKNIKNYKYSTDILPNTSNSQAQSPVMAASSQEPAVQKSLSHDNNVPQQPTAYSASMSTSSVQMSRVDKLKKPAQKSLSHDNKDPVNQPQPTGTSPPGVGTRNVFSIFFAAHQWRRSASGRASR